ncbi:MAG: restriction endonuclease [Alphaproteobacteria bacterium]
MKEDLIIPSQIPWEEIKAKDLEELMYWLLDSMGAKNLEWRIGGSGGGTSDQGRDLECTFYMTSPEGELVNQKWWVDAKGREKTVAPSDVKETILNVAAKDIDVLLISTNTHFSNPTRDWVKEYQVKNPRPLIKLWERTELEKHCSKNPLAVIRLFSRALSPQGKLEVLRSRLWNYSILTDEPTLKTIWLARDTLDISPETLLALVVSESVNGSFSDRAWGKFVNEDVLFLALVTFLTNFFFLYYRAKEQGIKEASYIGAVTYLILCCVDRFGAEKTSDVLEDWSDFDDRELPEEVKNFILQPVMGSLLDELRDVCTSDCSRVHTDLVRLTENQIEGYWQRLNVRDEIKEEKEKLILVGERNEERCKVGFCMSKGGCPVINNDAPEKHILKTLSDVEKIYKFRYKNSGK